MLLTLAHQTPYHAGTASMSPTLVRHSSYHANHLTQTSTTPTLSYCQTVLKTSLVSETSSYFWVRFQSSSVNPKWRCFCILHAATCDVLILHLPAMTIWGTIAVREAKGLSFGLFFVNFWNWLPVTHILISMDFRWTYNCLVKNIHICWSSWLPGTFLPTLWSFRNKQTNSFH